MKAFFSYAYFLRAIMTALVPVEQCVITSFLMACECASGKRTSGNAPGFCCYTIASHCSILDSARTSFIMPVRFNFNFIL
jgi:hypothetical protein